MFIDYGSDYDNIEPMKTPEYGKESMAQQSDIEYEITMKRHNDSLAELNSTEAIDIDKNLKALAERKHDPALEEENSSEENDFFKSNEEDTSNNDKAIEEYHRRHPEIKAMESYTQSLETISPVAIRVAKTIAMAVCVSVGSALADSGIKGITGIINKKRMGDVLVPYIEQGIADMINFGNALKALYESDIVSRCRALDPEGSFRTPSHIHEAIEKYSETYINNNKDKIAKYFSKLFIRLYSEYEKNNIPSIDKIALDYSETVITGNLSSKAIQNTVFSFIKDEFKKYGSMFDVRINWYDADKSIVIDLKMTPSLNINSLIDTINKKLA